MSPLKVITILGNRPQFIKAAVVSRAIRNHNHKTEKNQIEELIVHTGQHFDKNMSSIFFEELDIPEPYINLNIHQMSHGKMTGRMLEKIEKCLIVEKPDLVLVYGDTNSTLAGALAAVKLHISVAHVEAGLRSFNRMMPEEHNRTVADHCSEILFCPTQTAVKNLMREGMEDSRLHPGDNRFRCRVLMVGDVMYDSVIANLQVAEKKSHIMDELDLEPKQYALATIHRSENTDNPENLRKVFHGLKQISNLGLRVIMPLHPRTLKHLQALEIITLPFTLIPPLGYLDLLMIEKNAHVILTDSGGIQKEAYWLKVPCITLRQETEWVETVDTGWNVLAGVEPEKFFCSLGTLKRPENHPELFGNGRAAEKIVDTINDLA